MGRWMGGQMYRQMIQSMQHTMKSPHWNYCELWTFEFRSRSSKSELRIRSRNPTFEFEVSNFEFGRKRRSLEVWKRLAGSKLHGSGVNGTFEQEMAKCTWSCWICHCGWCFCFVTTCVVAKIIIIDAAAAAPAAALGGTCLATPETFWQFLSKCTMHSIPI